MSEFGSLWLSTGSGRSALEVGLKGSFLPFDMDQGSWAASSHSAGLWGASLAAVGPLLKLTRIDSEAEQG